MHVALIAHSRHPIGEPFAGGLESMTWHLAQALLNRGHEITLYAAPGTAPLPGLRLLEVAPLRLSRAAEQDPSMPDPEWIHVHHAYLQVVRLLADAPEVDVVHNNSLHYLPLVMAATLPAPMLTTLHTPPTPWLESAVHLTERPRSRFAAVSAHTSAVWDHLVEADVVLNGVDTSCWSPGSGGSDLVWSGRIVPEKAPHLAIKAARLAGFSLRLAGPVADPHYFAREVEPMLDAQIRYVGHLQRDALSHLLGSSSAALVTPTWDEPYGLVAAEAMSCGTPVAGFARGGLPEVVGADGGVLVPADDVAALAAVLPEIVKRSRRVVREHAVRHCSLETMVDRYLDLYASMVVRDAAA